MIGNEAIIASVSGMLIFLAIGLVLVIYPNKVRQYDRRMTMIVKDPDLYRLISRMLGGFFIFGAVLIFLMLFVA